MRRVGLVDVAQPARAGLAAVHHTRQRARAVALRLRAIRAVEPRERDEGGGRKKRGSCDDEWKTATTKVKSANAVKRGNGRDISSEQITISPYASPRLDA